MARKKKIIESSEPVVAGEAESQRLKRKGQAEIKLEETQSLLATARLELAEAEKAYLEAGVGSSKVKKDEAQITVHDLELFSGHYKTVINVYERPSLIEKCRLWDNRLSSSVQFEESIQQEKIDAKKAAAVLADVIVSLLEKHTVANETADRAKDQAAELSEYGIKVREVRPSLVQAQVLVARALREALLAADLVPSEHFVKSCLGPHLISAAPAKKAAA